MELILGGGAHPGGKCPEAWDQGARWKLKNFFAAKIGREEVSPRGKERMAEGSEEKEPVLVPLCTLRQFPNE